jgi:hypothetical protein
MKSSIKFLLGLVAFGAMATPSKALTEEEILLGLQIATCFSSQGCYRGYQPNYHYPQPNYSFPNYPSHYQYNYPYSQPRVIIVPVQPQYRYTPPYSGYYFNQDRHRFRNPDRVYHNYGRQNYQDVRGQINQIYLNVLGREADLEGLNTYQDRYNNGWSLIDIQRDIANSQEARNLRRF